MKALLVLGLVSTLMFGCSNMNYDNTLILSETKRPPTTKVDILKGIEPKVAFENVAQFQFRGNSGDEIKALKEFQDKAKLIGADCVIVEWPPHHEQKGTAIGNFASVEQVYTYRALAVSYKK